jgi:hypothetical protein
MKLLDIPVRGAAVVCVWPPATVTGANRTGG